MKLSLAFSALYLASHLCGHAVDSTNAPLPSEKIEAGDSNTAVLVPAGHSSHEAHISTATSTNTSRSVEINISADTEENLDRSLKLRKTWYMWTQLGSPLSVSSSSETFGDGAMSVAMNDDGSRVVVGVVIFDPSTATPSSEVTVYDLLDNQWILVQTISRRANTSVNVAMSGNGNRITLQHSGFAYYPLSFYEIDENGTFQELPLMPGTLPPCQFDMGSKKLGMSKDGARIIQGFSTSNIGGLRGIYLLEYNPSISTYSIIFSESDSASLRLGTSVAISSDGNRIAYGSPKSTGVGGFVAIFENSGTNTQWTQIGEITNAGVSTAIGGVSPIALTGDGTRIVVGHPTATRTVDNETMGAGAVYVFDQTFGTSEWILQATIQVIKQEGDYGDVCGKHVSISHDGKKVGFQCDQNESYEQEQYIAVYEEDEFGAWSPVANNIKDSSRLTATIQSFAMTSDGEQVAMGVYDGMPSPPVAAATVHTLGSTVCHNSPLEMRVTNMNGSDLPFFCKWAKEGKGSICDPSETVGQLRSHCPRVCKTCQDFACADSEAPFVWNGNQVYCDSWLATMSPSEVADICKDHAQIRKTCRGTCGRCLQSN